MIFAFDIERLLVRTAIKDALVAAQVDCNGIERCDHLLAQFLSLLVFGDGDLFDVATEASVVDAVARKAVSP